MTHTHPLDDKIYGCPLSYRVEHRSNGNVIIVSFRRANRIMFECSPIGGKAVRALIETLLPQLPKGKGFLSALPDKALDAILNEWIGLDSPEGRERRAATPELTLGCLLTADRQRLLSGDGGLRLDASIKDDERAIRRMLEQYGDCPWREVTPERCASWLGRQSMRSKTDCKRIMLRWERLQLYAGITDRLVWDGYSPRDIRRHRLSQKRAVETQIEPVILTDGQCAIILLKIKIRLDNGEVTGIDMAVLLALCAMLSVEEISALNLSDFAFLSDYPNRLTVTIHHKNKKAKSNYTVREIEDPWERRTIPSPMLAAAVYHALVKQDANLEWPLCPTPANRQRRLTPDRLKAAMAEYLSDIHLTQTTDVPGVYLPHVVDILATTGAAELNRAGLEEEELRAIIGKHPQLTSAKHYYDRVNEGALNSIGAIQDRWLHRVLPNHIVATNSIPRIKATTDVASWCTDQPGTATHIITKVRIPPVPPDKLPKNGLCLEIHSVHALSGSITTEYYKGD